jgi:hypothetical protein
LFELKERRVIENDPFMTGLLFFNGFKPENSKIGAIQSKISPNAKQTP